MKTIITTIALVLTATTASATYDNDNNVQWNGNSGTLHTDGCQFKDQTNGVMTLNSTTGKWTTTSAAKITVKSVNKNNIKVTSDNILRSTSDADLGTATVNYKNGGVSSSVTSNNSNSVVNINTNEIAVGNVNKTGATVTTFNIGGTAQMTDLDDLQDIDNNQAVHINHTVTCMQ